MKKRKMMKGRTAKPHKEMPHRMMNEHQQPGHLAMNEKPRNKQRMMGGGKSKPKGRMAAVEKRLAGQQM
jgi:hypothetical protein